MLLDLWLAGSFNPGISILASNQIEFSESFKLFDFMNADPKSRWFVQLG